MLRTSLAAAFLLSLCVACGDGEASWVREARGKFDTGDYDAAEHLIAACDGDAASDLKAEITKARAERAEAERQIENLLAKTDAASMDQAKVTLTTMRQNSKDPQVRERAERALADLAGTVAKHAGDQRKRDEAAAQERMAAEAAAETQRVQGVLNEVKRAMAKKDWGNALTLVKKGLDEQTAPAEDLKALNKQVIDGGVAEISRTITETVGVAQASGNKAAYDHMKAVTPRFPRIPEFQSLYDSLHDWAVRAGVKE